MSGRSSFAVGRRVIADGAPAFVIAEAGVNHNGDAALARRLVDIAAEARADAVKFQAFSTDALVSTQAPKAAYQRETTGADETQHEMLRRLELTSAQQASLARAAADRGLVFFSSVFDEASVDALDAIGVPLFKVPSGEITNLPLLRRVAGKGKPIILSTGMSTMDEVADAVAAIHDAGDPPLALLHCVSAYPAPAAETNLRAMDTLRERFQVPVGLSDHTLGIAVALAAVARGACIIEKHFTVDRSLPGPDHRASLSPPELRELVGSIRTVEASIGTGEKGPTPSELDTRRVARKSLVAARAIAAGETLTAELLRIKRPGTGISPAELSRAVGRRVRRDLVADEVIDWAVLE